jgi:hypothetical protein
MGNTPTTQTWLVTIPTTIPTKAHCYKDLLGIQVCEFKLAGETNVIADLNALPQQALNDVLAGVYDIGKFVTTAEVSSIQITNAHWAGNSNNQANLVFNMTTVSDPLTAADVALVIIAGLETLAGVIFAATAWNAGLPVALIALVSGGLFLTAGLTVLSVTVSTAANIYTVLEVVAVVAAVGVIGYAYFSRKPKRSSTSRRRRRS